MSKDKLPTERVINDVTYLMEYPSNNLHDIELWEIDEATPVIDWNGNLVFISGNKEDDTLHVIAYGHKAPTMDELRALFAQVIAPPLERQNGKNN